MRRPPKETHRRQGRRVPQGGLLRSASLFASPLDATNREPPPPKAKAVKGPAGPASPTLSVDVKGLPQRPGLASLGSARGVWPRALGLPPPASPGLSALGPDAQGVWEALPGQLETPSLGFSQMLSDPSAQHEQVHDAGGSFLLGFPLLRQRLV